MSPVDDVWLSALLVALFGLLAYLRHRFPKASRSSQTAVLIAATVVFFSICNWFASAQAANSPHRELIQTKDIAAQR